VGRLLLSNNRLHIIINLKNIGPVLFRAVKSSVISLNKSRQQRWAKCKLEETMKRIILLMAIISLSSSMSFAVDKTLDRKQIYELRKECGKSATEFAGRHKLCDGRSGYINHFNIKLNVCFIHMTASCNSDKENDDKFWAESLIDINENKEHATYVGSAKLVDDRPAMCYVGGKQCKSLLEFKELIKPYMSE